MAKSVMGGFIGAPAKKQVVMAKPKKNIIRTTVDERPTAPPVTARVTPRATPSVTPRAVTTSPTNTRANLQPILKQGLNSMLGKSPMRTPPDTPVGKRPIGAQMLTAALKLGGSFINKNTRSKDYR
jgi:hypothetical protein